MARYCDACGSPVGDDDLFCINCGARLTPVKKETPKPAPTPAHAAPAVPTPPHFNAQPQPVQPKTASYATTGDKTPAQASLASRVPPIPATKPVPHEHAASLSGLYNNASFDDVDADNATVVYGDDDDPDAPTFVFEPDPVYVLVRKATGEEFVVKDGQVIGKGTKADVRVSGNHGISRRHLRFSVQDDHCTIEDLDSTNGTFFGEERLQPGVLREIDDGTSFRVADETFEFEVRK